MQTPPYEAADVAQGASRALAEFLFPLLVRLDHIVDKRLVRTFLLTIHAMITFRDRLHGLLLSELGGYILTAQACRAGTKRLANLLHSPKWSAQLIHDLLWRRATQFIGSHEQQGATVLAIWDESVWEKVESEHLEDLCAVRSSKAYRFTRIRKGFYRPGRGRQPAFVPGLHWLGLLIAPLAAASGPPLLAASQWWTTRGQRAERQRRQEGTLLLQCVAHWGRRVVHIFDRGFATIPWLAACLALQQRFVLRWPQRQYLRDEAGFLRKPGRIARGKRSWGTRQIWDARRHCWRPMGVLAFALTHPQLPSHPLWLVISRPGKGRQPWYLLTNEPVTNEDEAWHIVFAYARRWQIEMTWRFLKSELGMECPRLRSWEGRERLLMMVTLAYAFLLTLLTPPLQGLRDWLLLKGCPRRGWRARETPCPLYRLRLALSRLWQNHPPQFTLLASRTLKSGPAP